MTDRLDAALRDLAARIDFPATPSLLPGIDRRVAASSGPVPRRRRFGRALILAVGLALLLAATVAAVAWVLPGLRITPVASVPAEQASDVGSGLALGDAISDIPSFELGTLDPPDAMYRSRDGSVLSLVYAAVGELPAMNDSGIGLLVQRIEGNLDVAMVEKLVEEVGAEVTPITVVGSDGFWIEGPPHLVRYLRPDGTVRGEMTRLAGDTLVWQDGEVLYRMESSLGLADAMRLAESVADR